jgi:hypothetical protein
MLKSLLFSLVFLCIFSLFVSTALDETTRTVVADPGKTIVLTQEQVKG